jgi:hypothetical protein
LARAVCGFDVLWAARRKRRPYMNGFRHHLWLRSTAALGNIQLCPRRRAESVRRELVQHDPAQLSRYHAIGFGEDAPADEVATLGEGAERRQAVIVLVERTLPGSSARPVAETQEEWPR